MMDNNLEELKRQWQQMSVKVDELSEANRRLSERLAGGRVKSLQERLASRISRYAAWGLLMPLLAPLMYFELQCPLWVCLLYAFFGILMFVIDWRFSKFIERSNLIQMPVVEAIKCASIIKLRQQRLLILGIIMAIFLLISIVYTLPDINKEAVYIGGSIGIIIGLSIGVPRAIVNARLARRIIESLHDIDSEQS